MSRSPVAEQVYGEVLSRILSGELQAEERITIDALGRDLGVSQTPIREALHRLDADGLVVHAHLSGYRVAPRLTREQFEALVEIRLLLEPAAARYAASGSDEKGRRALQQAAACITPDLIDTSDHHAYARFSQLDAALHNSIAAQSGNSFIEDAVSRLHTHARLFRLSDRADITIRAIDEHSAIVAAITERAPDRAAEAMREHLERSAERFRTAFRS
ncbi:GntR family transcriptional regulator [Mycetocola miduiensis]|nr:GntR family transcriptional regulator [Mycetocola miduiensis]